MSKKTIAKFCFIVILLAGLAVLFSACSGISSKEMPAPSASHYFPPQVIGRITSADVIEASGIAASKCQSDVLWTHNDSGDGPFIFAFKPSGESLGTWKVKNAENGDWEDISEYKDGAGKCFLYIGDIGDNKKKGTEHTIYKISEPVVKASDAGSDIKNPLITNDPADSVSFAYPEKMQNAETLMVHPTSGSIYVLTKRVNGPSRVYRIEANFGSSDVQKAQLVAEISVPAIPNGLLTGGDISPDGKRVIICDYTQAYELTLPENASAFDEIWKQKPEIVDLGQRKQGEAVCYSADGTALFATSEGKKPPVIEVKRRPEKGGETLTTGH
jgi:hypothetical protein